MVSGMSRQALIVCLLFATVNGLDGGPSDPWVTLFQSKQNTVFLNNWAGWYTQGNTAINSTHNHGWGYGTHGAKDGKSSHYDFSCISRLRLEFSGNQGTLNANAWFVEVYITPQSMLQLVSKALLTPSVVSAGNTGSSNWNGGHMRLGANTATSPKPSSWDAGGNGAITFGLGDGGADGPDWCLFSPVAGGTAYGDWQGGGSQSAVSCIGGEGTSFNGWGNSCIQSDPASCPWTGRLLGYRSGGYCTNAPTTSPTLSPTKNPTVNPTLGPTNNPSVNPTVNPTYPPSTSPTKAPTSPPSVSPTRNPTLSPTEEESKLFPTLMGGVFGTLFVVWIAMCVFYCGMNGAGEMNGAGDEKTMVVVQQKEKVEVQQVRVEVQADEPEAPSPDSVDA